MDDDGRDGWDEWMLKGWMDDEGMDGWMDIWLLSYYTVLVIAMSNC